ncbi:ANL_collapsed_G0027770.mRNA.1.CDS.1 [Saccharomyces cerevisiae]|nr:ANL_collapsed_G0027770.mRNA.1.CDS.1 [Saccharomyces cerevisiae]
MVSCTIDQPNGFTCANGRTVFNASLSGLCQSIFSHQGRIYNGLMWFFLIGFAIPLAVYASSMEIPNSNLLSYILHLYFSQAPGNIPPSTPYN